MDVQIATGNGYRFENKATAGIKMDEQEIRKETEELLSEYEALGHGLHFQGKLPNNDQSKLILTLNEALDLKLQNLTVLWTSHNFLFLILHEPKNFI